MAARHFKRQGNQDEDSDDYENMDGSVLRGKRNTDGAYGYRRRSQPPITESSHLQVYVNHAANSPQQQKQVDELRKSLRQTFSSPCQKFKERRKFPFKLVLQLLKVFIVTWQLVIFSFEVSTFKQYSQINTISFHHVFLKDWSYDRETIPYPPIGEYAVYTQDELYEHLTFVIKQYDNIDDVSLARLTYNTSSIAEKPPIRLDLNYFKRAELFPWEERFDIDPSNITESLDINGSDLEDAGNCTDEERIKCYLSGINKTLDLDRLVGLRFTFSLKGIYVKRQDTSISRPIDDVQCVEFIVYINYDNGARNGRIKVSLNTKFDMRKCASNNTRLTDDAVSHNYVSITALTAFDVIVMVICLISLTLTSRSIYRRCLKLKETRSLFKDRYSYTLTIPEYFQFISMWFVQIALSDVMVLGGSCLKIVIRYGRVATATTFNNDVYVEAASIMLALASLMEWVGIIRFLNFFSRYYVLILTLSKAAPPLIRFLVTTLTIYFGFLFAGWIVLGPHHPKFATFSASAECLFALINGDEIFTTFSIISDGAESITIWLFSRVYLYSFIMLFIIAIFNLFIAVINDSYETVKDWQANGFPVSFLDRFIEGNLTEIPLTTTQNRNKKQSFVRKLNSEDIDDQYGICSSLLCCLDCCVHHNVNSQPEDASNTNSIEMEPVEDGGVEIIVGGRNNAALAQSNSIDDEQDYENKETFNRLKK